MTATFGMADEDRPIAPPEGASGDRRISRELDIVAHDVNGITGTE
jgi:hypothetical protein